MAILKIVLLLFVVAADSKFTAVWNCPYMGKKVVNISGLSANPSGSFNGSIITLFYGPGTWPRLKATRNPLINPCWEPKRPCTWNESMIWSNITIASNGGVPQEGDIEVHKEAVASLVEEMIPDVEFSGYGIFDWEDWRVLYKDNYDSLSYTNYYSTLLVKERHPDWTNSTRISKEAERQFNQGAKLFFTETLRTAKKLRPKGKFGFYEYPMVPSAELTWLWQEVGVMAGSEYMKSTNSTAQSVNNSITAVKLAREAAIANGTKFVRPDILTYVRLWPASKPVSDSQLTASVRTPSSMGADGIIIWGASSDARVTGYSNTIESYLKTTVGPLIEKCSITRAKCATDFCNGHGRCSNFDANNPENGCELVHKGVQVKCLCDAAYQGTNCEISSFL
jgi:hyaluronoglucosaminidase